MTCQLRQGLLELRQSLSEAQARARAEHDAGAAGRAVCAMITAVRDRVIRELWEEALAETCGGDRLGRATCLVAHGGYGRGDLAPYSDVDLLLLHAPSAAAEVGPLAQRLVRDVCDTGLLVGHSAATPAQACRLACQDAVVGTSLLESRRLAGSEGVFESFRQRFRRQVQRQARGMLKAVERSRREERLRYGETVFLLEPNVKRSRGALRDLQFLRWVGSIRYDRSDPESLARAGLLSSDDARQLEAAYEFLLRVRNELHFHAGRGDDVLDRGEQLRMAEALGYPGREGLLPVEQFMRDYFRHTHQVSHLAEHLTEQAQARPWRSWWITALFGHKVQAGLRAGPAGLVATRRGGGRLENNLNAVLQLVDLANLYDLPVAPATWDVVRRSGPRISGPLDREAREHFLSLLDHPTRLGEILRHLHDATILQRVLPAFAHARGLLQFNQYHKYTVDEHCLRAVEAATEFARNGGPLGQVYRGLARKWLLHLALLIHDLGKGHADDHVARGVQIADETAARLRLSGMDAESLRFLVGQHQAMGQLALHRDTSDPALVLRFAVEVGSPERLAMLFLLTAADFTAVGPDVWDGWKEELVSRLYVAAREHLAGDTGIAGVDLAIPEQQATVAAELGLRAAEPWFARQLAALPGSYLASTSPRQVAEDLLRLRRMEPGEVFAQGEYRTESGTVQFTIGTEEGIVPGIFHRLTGVLASRGLEILSAQIHTLADGWVLDRFWASDPDYAGVPPEERIEEVCSDLEDALRRPSGEPPRFRRVWKEKTPNAGLLPAENRVSVDNGSSDRYTVLDIFTRDRTGLLYAIARRLFELGLSVARARIATYVDQVVDVFYVTDRHGGKVEDPQRLVEIREALGEVLAG